MSRKPKYRNKKTVVDGLTFDSAHEARVWQELRLLERAGQITDLKRQVRFPFEVNSVKIGTFVADFTYMENGALVVVDAKSAPTAKLPVYVMKKKLMRALYSIEVQERFNSR